MTEELGTALILLSLFQVKHMLADFFLQTPRMLIGRNAYLHIGRAQHAGVHAALSVVTLVLVGAPAAFVAVIVAIEWIVHFHIDWVKAVHSVRSGHGPDDPRFWSAFGTDQALHQLTYVAMIWAWAVWA